MAGYILRKMLNTSERLLSHQLTPRHGVHPKGKWGESDYQAWKIISWWWEAISLWYAGSTKERVGVWRGSFINRWEYLPLMKKKNIGIRHDWWHVWSEATASHWAPRLRSFTTNIHTDGQRSLTETWGDLVPLLFLNPWGLALWPSEMPWTSLNLSFEPCGPLHPLLCSNHSSRLVDMPCFPLLPGLCFC